MKRGIVFLLFLIAIFIFNSKNVFGAGQCVDTDSNDWKYTAGITYIEGSLETTAEFDYCDTYYYSSLLKEYSCVSGVIKEGPISCACWWSHPGGTGCWNASRILGNITVQTYPSGANITLDRNTYVSWGPYPLISPVNISNIFPGSHLIQIRKIGYYNYSEIIYINDGSTNDITITLTPIPKSSGGSPFIFKKQIATESSGDIMRSPASSNRFVAITVGVIGILVASGLVYTFVIRKKK